MQLIQIGETKQKTVMDLVLEMASRQVTEMQQLKNAALTRSTERSSSRARRRCASSQTHR